MSWVWFFYYIGMSMYWLKRAYFGIQKPNAVANGYGHYMRRSWAPLLIRSVIDSFLFWILFTPGIADKGLAYLGWTSWAFGVILITQVPPVAGVFGFFIDSVVV